MRARRPSVCIAGGYVYQKLIDKDFDWPPRASRCLLLLLCHIFYFNKFPAVSLCVLLLFMLHINNITYINMFGMLVDFPCGVWK